MTDKTVEQVKADQNDYQLKAEEEYREFLCREEYKGKECGFQVRAKTDDEVIEHAHMHQKMAHGVKDISPDLEEKIKANIRPIKPGDPRATKKSSLLGTCY
jgi:predicted small metal-binding protein